MGRGNGLRIGVAVGLLLGLGGLLTWGLAAGDDPVLSPVETTALALQGDGHDADVIDCVLRLAARDLAVGPLDTTALEELVAGCQAARDDIARADRSTEPPVDELALTDQPDTFGDDPELDRLWVACEQGSGAACDELFERAPIGSGYESFGVGCGDRPDVLHCSELDQPTDGSAGS